MSINSDFYFYSRNSETNEQKSVRVTVKSSSKLNILPEGFENVVKHCLTSDLNVKKITLTEKSTGQIFYSINGKKEKDIVELSGESSSWEIRSLSLPELSGRIHSVKVRRKRWINIYKEFRSQQSDVNFLVRFWLSFAFLPIKTTFSYLFVGEKMAAADLLAKLRDESSLNSPEHFESSLERQCNLAERLKDRNLLAGLKKMTVWFKKTRTQDHDDVAKEIQKGLEKAPQIIPFGMYIKNKYTPMMIELKLAENDDVSMKIWSFGDPCGEYKGVIAKDKNVEFLSHLFSLSKTKDAPFLLTKEEGKKKKIYQEAIRMNADLINVGLGAPSVASVGETRVAETISDGDLKNLTADQPAIAWMNQVLKSVGGNPGRLILPVDGEKSITDGWDYLKRVMISEKGVSKEKKIQFAMDLINEQVELMLKGMDRLTKKDRQNLLSILERRTQKLETRMNAVFGEGAYKFLIEDQQPENLRPKYLVDLRKKLERLKTRGAKVRQADSTEKSRFVFVPSTPLKNSKITAVNSQNTSRLQAQLTTLEKCIKDNDVAGTKTCLSKLDKNIDALVEAKKYKIALDTATKVQLLLPTPTSGADFWSRVDLNPLELDSWGELIHNVGKNKWEAFVRMHKPYASPAEMVGIMNQRAVLVELARLKYKAYQKIEDKNTEEKIAFEYCKVFDRYQTDFRQFFDILHYHPHLRTGIDVRLDKKAEQIRLFFESDRGPVKKRIILRLDSEVGALEMYSSEGCLANLHSTEHLMPFKEWDDEYLKAMYQAKASLSPVSVDSDSFSRCKINELPQEMQRLRQDVAMTQMMFRPEYSLALHFGPGPVGSMAALKWLMKKSDQAAEETLAHPERYSSRVSELAYADLSSEIDSVKGRLSLEDSTYFSERTFVVKDSKSEKKFYYLPFSLNFPESLAKKFNAQPIDMNAAGSAPDVPEEWLLEPVGKRGGEEKKCSAVANQDARLSRRYYTEPSGNPSVDRFLRTDPEINFFPGNRSFQPRTTYTEVDQMVRCIGSSKDPITDFLMKTLELDTLPPSSEYWNRIVDRRGGLDTRDAGLVISPSSGLFALQVALSRYDLLSSPAVRQRLELVFTRSSLIRSLISTHPATLEELGGHLRRTTMVLKNQNLGTEAAYLMHLSELFKQNIPVASPLRDKFLGYSGDYLENEQTGLDHLRDVLAKEQDLFLFCLAEKEMGDSRSLKRRVEEASVENYCEWLNLARSLEFGFSTLTTPMQNEHLHDWVKSKLMPAMARRLRQDAVLRSELADKLSGTRGLTWEFNRQDPFVLTSGKNKTLDLQRGVYISFGKVEQAATQEILIPQPIKRLLPDLVYLEAEGEIKAEFKAGVQSGEWLYSFKAKGASYQIVYNNVEETASLSLVYGKKTYQKASLLEPVKGSVGSLVESYGLWVNSKNKRDCIVPVLQKGGTEIWKLRLNRNGTVSSIKDGRNGLLRPVSRVDAGVLPSVHPSHMYKQADKKIRMLCNSYGLSSSKNGYELVDRHNKKHQFAVSVDTRGAVLQGLLGKEVCARLKDENSSEKLLLWLNPMLPANAAQSSKGNPIENLEDAFSRPVLEVVVDQKGDLTASSAAHLYMAYVLTSRKEYKLAQRSLERAERSSLKTEEDRNAFKIISSMIRETTPKTGRAIALQLKMECFLMKEEGHQAIQVYQPGSPMNYQERALRLGGLYQSYKQISNRQDSRLSSYPDLALNEEEKDYFETLHRESMVELFTQSLSEKISTLIATQPQVIEPLRTKTVSTDVFTTIALLAKKPPKDDRFLLSPPMFSAEHVLTYFPTYFNQIASGNILFENLKFLFNPFSSIENGDSAEAAMLLSHAETARKILIQTALAVKDEAGSIEALPDDFWNQKTKVSTEKPKYLSTLFNLAIKRDPNAYLNAPTETIRLLNKSVQSAMAKPKFFTENAKDLLTMDGIIDFKDMRKFLAKVDNKIQLEKAVDDFDAIVEDMNLSGIEKNIFLSTFTQLREANPEGLSLEKFQIGLTEALGLSPVELRREKEVSDSIRTLELHLEGEDSDNAIYESDHLDQRFKAWAIDKYFEDLIQQDVVTTTLEDKFKSEVGLEAVKEKEYEEMRNGLKAAVAEIKAETRHIRTIRSGQWQPLKDKIAKKKQKAEEKAEGLKASLNAWIHSNNSPISLRQQAKQPGLYSNEELLEIALNEYQSGKIEGADITKQITDYLLFSLEARELAKAEVIIAGSVALPDTNKQAELCQLLSLNANTCRYLETKDGELQLKNPLVLRKVLVSERRQDVIFRESQLNVIQELVDNPKQCINLKMGAGKTAIIMPVVAALLAELKNVPFMMVPEALEAMNKAEFDMMTRKVFGTKAHPFRVDLTKSSSSAYLASVYKDILNLRVVGGYAVTTVQALASVSNLIVSLREDVAASLKFLKTETVDKGIGLEDYVEQETENSVKLMKFMELEKRLFWLRKIEIALDGQGPINPILFGDEVDSILHITKEINGALGAQVLLDADIRNVTHTLIETILGELQSENPNQHVTKLANCLMDGSQTSIQDPREVKQIKRSVARLLVQADAFQEGLPDSLTLLLKDPTKSLVNYLCGLNSDVSLEIKTLFDDLDDNSRKECQKIIGVAKHLISKTVPTFLSVDPGLAYKLEDEGGFMVVPCVQSNEAEGNRYGNEYDLIAFQYLGYLQLQDCQGKKGNTKRFLEKALKQVLATSPRTYGEIKDLISEGMDHPLSISEMAQRLITERKFYKERLAILKLVVFEGGLIKRYPEQVTKSAQSVVFGRHFGGVTGTLNAYAMPDFHVDPAPIDGDLRESVSTRTVEAGVCLNAAGREDAEGVGLQASIDVFDDTDESAVVDAVVRMTQDPDCVAIVNEGNYGIKGKGTADFIRDLRARQTASGLSHKNILYISEVDKQPYLWKKQDAKPHLVNKEQLFKQQRDWIAIYTAEFTRGTDLPLKRQGIAYYLPGRKTNPQDMCQSMMRARQLGQGQKVRIFMPKSVPLEASPIVADVFKWVTDRGIEDRSPVNLSSVLFRIKELARSSIRKGLNQLSKVEEEGHQFSDPAKLEGAFVLEMANNSLHNYLRGYFINSKEIDFSVDFTPTSQKRTLEYLQDVFDSEITQIEKKMESLAIQALMINDQAIPEDQENTSLALTQFFEEYAQTEVSQRVNCLDLLDQELTNQLGDNAANTKIVLTRFADMYVWMYEAKASLVREKESLENNWESVHQQYLNEMTEASGGDVMNAQEQVQQQQQQQQQVSTPDKKNQMLMGDQGLREWTPWNINEIASKRKTTFTAPEQLELWGIEDAVCFSREMKDLVDLLPSRNGTPLGVFCINHDGNVSVCSKQDYIRVIEENKDNLPCKVVLPTASELVTLHERRPSRVPIDEEVQNLALAKVLLGYKIYTDVEKASLRRLFDRKSNEQKKAFHRWCKDLGISF